MAVSEFDIGDRIQVRVTFTASGTPTDPTEVSFRMQPPTAAEVSEVYNGGAGNVQKESTGVYTYDYTILEPGVHVYRWKGTGAVVAATKDTPFLVRTTVFASP